MTDKDKQYDQKLADLQAEIKQLKDIINKLQQKVSILENSTPSLNFKKFIPEYKSPYAKSATYLL